MGSRRRVLASCRATTLARRPAMPSSRTTTLARCLTMASRRRRARPMPRDRSRLRLTRGSCRAATLVRPFAVPSARASVTTGSSEPNTRGDAITAHPHSLPAGGWPRRRCCRSLGRLGRRHVSPPSPRKHTLSRRPRRIVRPTSQCPSAPTNFQRADLETAPRQTGGPP